MDSASYSGASSAFLILPLETQIFLFVIIATTFFMHWRFDHRTSAQGSTILTTLGIFATFFGIAIGLSKFDSSNIQGSVPSLLAGLKTAFWASVFGVGGALTLKYREYAFGVRSAVGDVHADGEIGAADIANLLRSINSALVGGEDSSLITQMKLGKQDTNDRLDALKAAQLEALNKLSEMGSKALIEALKEVIRDFNTKLSEQFGDNFKQLNIAVGRLVEWQDKYAKQVEEINKRFEATCATMEKATADYVEVVQQSGKFTETATHLGQLLSTIADEKQRFAEMSKSLASMLLSASGSLPEIEKKIVALTEQLGRSVSDNAIAVSNSISSAHQAMIASNSDLNKQLNTALNENASSIKNTVQSAHQAMTSTSNEYNKQIDELIRKTKDQIVLLDKSLSDELEKSLTSLARQLTALSERFVSDYSPLTDKLRDIVQMARRVGA